MAGIEKTTRGEWFYDQDDNHIYVESRNEEGVCVGFAYEPQNADGVFYENYGDLSETDANGFLMSAAPEMYKALEFFVDAIAQRRPGWEWFHDTLQSNPEGTAWDDAAQALVKARGERRKK